MKMSVFAVIRIMNGNGMFDTFWVYERTIKMNFIRNCIGTVIVYPPRGQEIIAPMCPPMNYKSTVLLLPSPSPSTTFITNHFADDFIFHVGTSRRLFLLRPSNLSTPYSFA